MIDDNSGHFSCSFCKKKKNEVQKLIAGKNSKGMVTFICDLCTEVCYNALKNNTNNVNNKNLNKKIQLINPKEIFDELCKHVESQDGAKKNLAVAAYNHYKRILYPSENINIEKSNILMIGKSGSGKTLLVETLSRILKVPFISVDVTTLTEAGYVGEDVENILVRLLNEAKHDINEAQKGIVFLDEFDKLKRKSNSLEGSVDVSGVGVQQSLLKFMEGTKVQINNSGKKNYSQETIVFNTKNVLFICAGAFEDLTKIIAKDVSQSYIGLHAQNNKKEEEYNYLIKHVKNEHLIKYGIIPEILGRLQIQVVLEELSVADLINILVKPQNAILKQYQHLLQIKDKAELKWTKDALKEIALQAIKNKSGARGLKSIVEKILLQTMFDIPSMNEPVQIIINKKVVQSKSLPKIINIKPMPIVNKIKKVAKAVKI